MVWSAWVLYCFSCLSGWAGWWVWISECDRQLFPMPSSCKQQSTAEGSCPALCFKLPRLPKRHQAATKPERNGKGFETCWRRRLCSLPEKYFEKSTAQWPYQEHRIFIARALCLDATAKIQNGLLSHLLGLMPQWWMLLEADGALLVSEPAAIWSSQPAGLV